MRNRCGIRKVDRVRNAIIRERWGCELSLLEKKNERNMLKWFGHVERWYIGQMWRVTWGEEDHKEDEGIN